MELRQLRYFLAVAEDLHFTRAAERLHVAQPALSQQISQLEREVGVKLLERTSRSVVLTPAGEVFRKRAGIAIEQLERAAADAGTIGRGEAGILSLGFVSAAVVNILPVVMRWFRQEIPAAVIDLREMEPSEQIESIRQRHLDIGLFHASIQAPELASMMVIREKLIVALPENHPAACKEQVELKSFSKETIFLPRRHTFPGFYELVIQACQKEGFQPARLQPMNLLQTAVALVSGELGIALVPESFRHNLPVRGVIYKSLAEPAPAAEMIAVWREDNESPLLTTFRVGLTRLVQEGLLANRRAA
jgi:DNA-binding transcriptional LysR family regulator